MKIRQGFVSNSSSSSFIVAFPKKPESSDELKKMMFKDEEFHEGYRTSTIAEAVFMNVTKEASKEEIEMTLGEGTVCTKRKRPDTPRGLDNESWEKWEEENKKIDQEESQEFLKNNMGKYINIFGFSDEGCEFHGMLEHTGIFNNLPHIQVSCH